MFKAMVKTDSSEDLSGPVCGFAHRNAGNQGRHHDIFKCREFRQKLVELEDETDGTIAKIIQFLG